ncbi:T9SS type A sorting domain-containing protein [Candidatus Fermentibacteria bacterium]|nr:T9SS type A sorting domain-containing protein [Candidatus Fermentibacteria bacterium]
MSALIGFLACLISSPGVSEWEHFTHLGAVSDLALQGEVVVCATSGGVCFTGIHGDSASWDSVWSYPQRLSHCDARALSIDGEGGLWIGLHGGGIDLVRSDGSTRHYGQLEGLPLSLELTSIVPDTFVYAGTTEGLAIKEMDYFVTWTTYGTGGGLPGNRVTCLQPVEAGLVVGTNGNGISMLGAGGYPGDISSWLVYDETSGMSVHDMATSGDTVWAATSGALLRLLPDSSWQVVTGYPGATAFSVSAEGGTLAVGDVGRVHVRREGSWISSEIYGGQVIRCIELVGPDSLLAGMVGELSVERASGRGLAWGWLESWAYDWPASCPSNDLMDVTLDSAGDCWVSTNHNGAGVLSDGEWTDFQSQLSGSNQVFVCQGDPGGGVFVAPYHRGLDWLDWRGTPSIADDTLLHWDSAESGLLNDQVTASASASEGVMWIGQEPFWTTPGEVSGVVRLSWDPGDPNTCSWVSVSTSENLPSPFVNSVAAVSTSRAWAGTDEGAALVDAGAGEVVRVVGEAQGLPSSEVSAVAVGPNGRVYMGTTAGLSRLENDGSVSDVEPVQGMVGEVTVDNLSAVWAATEEAVYRILWDGDWEEFNPLSSPLLSTNVRAMTCDREAGLLYMATDHGLWRLTLESGLQGDGSSPSVFPNPFLPGRGEVLRVAGIPDEPTSLQVFDLDGSLVYESQSRNRSALSWEGRTAAGSKAASGTYLVRITQGGSFWLVKLALIR